MRGVKDGDQRWLASAVMAGARMGRAPRVSTAPLELELTDADTQTEPPWLTIVWNDPVNLMSYVTYVFMTYFGYPRGKAEQLMLDVHFKGKAVVASGSREQMERDATAMHSYGLWATVSKGT